MPDRLFPTSWARPASRRCASWRRCFSTLGFVRGSLVPFRPWSACPVGFAVRGDLLIDALLLALQLGSFTGCQLPALDALGNPVLLVFPALADLVVAVLRGVGIVLVLIDLVRQVILVVVDLRLSAIVSFPPLAARSARISPSMAVSFVSRLLVSPTARKGRFGADYRVLYS